MNALNLIFALLLVNANPEAIPPESQDPSCIEQMSHSGGGLTSFQVDQKVREMTEQGYAGAKFFVLDVHFKPARGDRPGEGATQLKAWLNEEGVGFTRLEPSDPPNGGPYKIYLQLTLDELNRVIQAGLQNPRLPGVSFLSLRIR